MKRKTSSPQEVWLYKDCGVWAPGKSWPGEEAWSPELASPSHGARLGAALDAHRDPQNCLQSLQTQGLWLFSVWVLFLSPF